MATHAAHERQALVALMEQVGPDAPTLCAGWTTGDLAAHLVVRERRPDAAVGIVLPPLSGWTDQVQRNVRARPWPELLDAIRSGPPPLLRPLDETVNLVEYFVHHEDVRRAGRSWQPRLLDPSTDTALWNRLRLMAPILLRRAGVRVALEAPGRPVVTGGHGTATVRVLGPPAELLLAAFGRLAATAVELVGDEPDVRTLREARLGL